MTQSDSGEYRNVAALRRVLKETFAYVQVYSHLAEAALEGMLAGLRSEYPDRLLAVRGKAEVDASQLTARVDEAWKGTIAGEVADKVRDIVSSAVERCLIDMCSVRRQALASIAVAQPSNLIQIVLSKVRDEIGVSGADIFTEILKMGSGGESSPELRKLMSVWYYAFYGDDLVRRGDIIEVDGGLGLVVTPACDLAQFPKKAGCRLTWLRIVPFANGSLRELTSSGGLEFDQVGGSIVSQHGKSGEAIILLPNMPSRVGSRDPLEDNMILCHSWQTTFCETAAAGRLTYERTPSIRRRCTLAEPFVAAAIARASAVITSPAAPDIPTSERDRLRAIAAERRPARVVPPLPNSAISRSDEPDAARKGHSAMAPLPAIDAATPSAVDVGGRAAASEGREQD